MTLNMNKRKHEDDDLNTGENKPKNARNHENLSRKSSTNSTSLEFKGKIHEGATDQTQSKIQKVAQLIHALDEALDESFIDNLLAMVGEGTVNTCIDLQKTLRKEAAISDIELSAAISIPTSSQQASSSSTGSPNIPKALSPLSLTAWRASDIPKTLPALPEVLDPTLEESVFIHRALASKAHNLSYERLEWVGDAYIQLMSTLIISQTFPDRTPGESSYVRQQLVKNVTLADYAHQYRMPQRVKLPLDLQSAPEKEKTKIWGDVFEAYVAAVILSDPQNGITRCSKWLKSLWAMTLSKEIRMEEAKGPKLVTPMWNLMGGTAPVSQSALPKAALNPKERLTHKIGARGIKITYKDAAPEKRDVKQKLPLFTVGVYLDGWGEKDKQIGFGRGHGKKEAGFKAAEMALANEKLMKVYVEKKRLFDAQLALEEEAAAKQNVQ